MTYRQLTLMIAVTLFGSAAAYAVPKGASLSILVQEAEQKGELPKPVLELMVLDGTELEEATRVTVATSASGTYAQGFTYHAICMSISEDQAQRVHDIAIDSATDKFKTGVQAEARYSLMQFKENGCADTEEPSKEVVKQDDPVEEEAAEVEDTVSEEDPITEEATERVAVIEEADVEELVLEESSEDGTVSEIEERVVTLEPIADTAITGTVAGGASASQ